MISTQFNPPQDEQKKGKNDVEAILFKNCNILRAICAHPYTLQHNEIAENDENIDRNQEPQSHRSDKTSNCE